MLKTSAFVSATGRKRQGAPESQDVEPCPLFGLLDNLYDPANPNDYEAVVEERERKKREAELEAEKQEQLKHQTEQKQENEKGLKRQSQQDVDSDEKRQRPHHEAEDEAMSEPFDPPKTGQAAVQQLSTVKNLGEGKGMNLAQKMLEKFGWREGDGLGKERQGMAAPLMAQKTNKRSAVIVKSHSKQKKALSTHKQAPQSPIKEKPTRVVLLRNLVGPGEVDDNLEDEVAMELQKYGTIRRVLIFEVTEDDFPAEEAVRIFIEFQSIDDAKKAASALNGRFFGGRNVRAGYYDEIKFASCDLAPIAGSYG